LPGVAAHTLVPGLGRQAPAVAARLLRPGTSRDNKRGTAPADRGHAVHGGPGPLRLPRQRFV